MALQESCQACGSPTLDTKGFGTEQVEKELETLFPDAKTWRMDLDTTRGKHGYEKIITAFEQQEMDILVGTQMLTKGLDFRNVSLVGIMNADSLLNFPDYRAHERCFQLLTQVAGRAGRTKKKGKVIIQSYNPLHQILKQVSNNDYDGMFKEQLYEREQYKYPPNNRIIKITFKHKEYNRLNEAAEWFAKALRNSLGGNVLGPEYPPVARIRNQYLKNVVIKIPYGQSLSKTKTTIKKIEKSFNAISQYRSVRVIYNVDHIWKARPPQEGSSLSIKYKLQSQISHPDAGGNLRISPVLMYGLFKASLIQNAPRVLQLSRWFLVPRKDNTGFAGYSKQITFILTLFVPQQNGLSSQVTTHKKTAAPYQKQRFIFRLK
mgnify:CR=1 FL=1